jgi:class 3 adenylate cyclase
MGRRQTNDVEDAMADTPTAVPLLITFVDLSRFMVQSRRTDDLALAETLDAFYEHVGAAARGAGGRVVKFLGDAALIVFPEADVDRGVAALLDLKDTVDDLMVERGWECRLIVQAHFGTAIAGPFGAAGDKHYDVLGAAVNTAATLDSSGVALSVEAFRKLGPDLRTRFKKHTPPITYIAADDPRPR